MASDILVRLIAQAEGEGASLVTLAALAEEASETAVQRALERLGLTDPRAREDLGELRTMLRAWRDAKAAARNAFIGWLVRLVLAAVMFGLAVRFGLAEWMR